MVERILGTYEVIQRLKAAEEQSGYQVEKLLEAAADEGEIKAPDANQEEEQTEE
jgi:hypothetical protein